MLVYNNTDEFIAALKRQKILKRYSVFLLLAGLALIVYNSIRLYYSQKYYAKPGMDAYVDKYLYTLYLISSPALV